MREAFESWKPRKATRIEWLKHIVTFTDENLSQGRKLGARGCAYKLLTLGLMEATKENFEEVETIVKRGRLAGYIDWDAIEDTTRGVNAWHFDANVEGMLRDLYFHIDPWHDQPYRPEVWIEKRGLLGIIRSICQRHRVMYVAGNGDTSDTVLYEAATHRFQRQIENGHIPVILYAGDHDPTGLRIFETIKDKIALYRRADDVIVKRIALTRDQVDEHDLIPFDTKEGDPNRKRYEREHGEECWELDGLAPEALEAAIDNEITELIDQKLWKRSLKLERENNALLRKLGDAERWKQIVELLKA